ncbi:IST1-like protein [Phalaenopsis equestris]|uniref:IST1-like protein n=1 Tax=Phalaenopsis equestris TaxID=78828 RepID=UPI0009E4525F|nr:IST1-like protein [Phalaenopsis equestris]
MPQEKSPFRSLQKLAGLALLIFLRRFNPSKCKTEANLVSARIKLLRNKREAQLRQMRRDIAMLLQSGQEDTARIRVEQVIREQKVLAANEIINLFCELIVVRLPIIQKQRDCPADLKEAISSVIYSAPRCSDIPELSRIRDIFEKKYGKDFVSAATDLRPESGVNRMLIEKLSIKKPAGELKLKVMKEIAKEYQIEWDAKETEFELLKPPEELIEGPRTFISASSFPIKSNLPPQNVRLKEPTSSDGEGSSMHFKDTASAAQAAAESAKKAASAAQAAAFLAQQSSNESRRNSLNSINSTVKRFSSQSFNVSRHMNDEDDDGDDFNDKKILRRNSTTGHRFHSDIKFDESDGFDSDSEIEVANEAKHRVENHGPPARLPPNPPKSSAWQGDKAAASNWSANSVPHIHPKLPDYEEIAARFEALKSHRT